MGNDAVGFERAPGTLHGPYTGPDGKTVPSTYKKYSADQMKHLVLDLNGRIKSHRAYFNPAEIYKQLGLHR